MNKTQFVQALAPRFGGDKRSAALALDAVLDTLTRQVAAGERVTFIGFGTLEARMRPARTVRNPRTGESVQAPAKRVPRFRAGASLRALVAGEKELPAAAVSVPVTRALPAAAVELASADRQPAEQKADQDVGSKASRKANKADQRKAGKKAKKKANKADQRKVDQQKSKKVEGKKREKKSAKR